MRKRLLSTLLALCMVLALLPSTALAEDYPTSGTCGENATWTYDDSTRTLTISGSGEISALEADVAYYWLLDDTTKKVEKVKFNGTFIVIGDGVFSGFSNLKEITIPDSITTIGDYAFSGCTSLTNIFIPENVIRINYDHAFNGCTSLKNISVDTQNKIYASQDGMLLNKEKEILYICPNGMSSVHIPPSVKKIEQTAFSGCCNLTELVLPDTVTEIYPYESLSHLFLVGCTSLKKLTLSGGIKHWRTIYYGYSSLDNTNLTVAIVNEGTTSLLETFSGASKLTTVYLPASLKTIKANTFKNCPSLKEVYFAGTQAQWDSLIIDAEGNQELSLAKTICNTSAPGEVPSTPDNPDKPNTPDTPSTPDTPTTPAQLTATVSSGGLGKKVSVQVQSGHWLTIQTRRAGSISISSIQAPMTSSGTATVSFSAPSGSVIQIWETATEMQFSNGIPTTTILSTVVKNL